MVAEPNIRTSKMDHINGHRKLALKLSCHLCFLVRFLQCATFQKKILWLIKPKLQKAIQCKNALGKRMWINAPCATKTIIYRMPKSRKDKICFTVFIPKKSLLSSIYVAFHSFSTEKKSFINFQVTMERISGMWLVQNLVML